MIIWFIRDFIITKNNNLTNVTKNAKTLHDL
jgi:hypothetical protein